MNRSQRSTEAPARLDDVLVTDLLRQRPAGPRRDAAEARALGAVAEAMTGSPDSFLQVLADAAMDACGAESAGVSMLEWAKDGRRIFRWRAATGALATLAGGSIARDESPCGVVLEHDRTLLFRHPHRHFPALGEIDPPVAETLLAPLPVPDSGGGTLWIVTHSEDREFDAEDARLLGTLCRAASFGYRLRCELREARRASEAKSRFLATMSHELRTPLTGVIGYAELIEAEVAGPVTDKQTELLERIQSNSWELVGIIDEILTASQVDSGRAEVRLSDCDLMDLVRGVVQTVETQIAGRDLRLVVEPCQGGPTVRTDPLKVRRILTNLIGNAVKYTDRGEVRILVEAAPASPIRVHVRDTGPGIPPEHHDRIFEPFTRFDDPGGGDRGGTGLGLAICRKLASLVDGRVIVESVPGMGSTFTLELPR